jgi:predicted O-methyltransferase YrrM
MELGPVQNEDVLLLQAVIKMTCPVQLVELGYLNGFSTQKILEAMRDDACLTSYDNTIQDSSITDKRFTFKNKSQTEVNEQNIDFIFFDASHDFEINKKTFENLDLADKAIIAVHDTGLWDKMILDTGGHWVGNGYAHRPDEIKFVDWLKGKGYNSIDFHTLKETRHGMTLLQK